MKPRIVKVVLVGLFGVFILAACGKKNSDAEASIDGFWLLNRTEGETANGVQIDKYDATTNLAIMYEFQAGKVQNFEVNGAGKSGSFTCNQRQPFALSGAKLSISEVPGCSADSYDGVSVSHEEFSYTGINARTNRPFKVVFKRIDEAAYQAVLAARLR